MRKTVKPLALIFLLSLLPAALFLIKGYSGDDFYFHVPSWMELRDCWRAGHVWSGWAFKANYTLGDPHFCFYPPFSFIVGAGLSVLLPLKLVPSIYLSLIAFISGLSMFTAATGFLPKDKCLAAACLYMLSPYLVMSELIHFSIAELLVQAWLPLILLWFFEAAWGGKRRSIPLGCLLGLGWLTDVPASIVLLYGLLLISLISAWEHKRVLPVWRFAASEAMGGMLAAFYLMPVLAEQTWINTKGLLARFSPAQFLIFLPGQWASGGKIPSWVLDEWAIACVSFVAIAICVYRRRLWPRETPPIRFWVYLAVVALFFHLVVSLPAWNWLPEMHAVQFPFRFLPFVGVALPMVLLADETPGRLRKPIYFVMLLVTLIPVQRFLRGSPITSLGKDSFSRLEAEWENKGYFSPPEYGHVAGRAFGFPLLAASPDAASRKSVADQLCSMSPDRRQLGKMEFLIETARPCTLILPVYFYPYWLAITGSESTLTTAANANGLLTVAIPEGRHTVQIIFRPASRVRSVSAALSSFALAVAIFWLFYVAVCRFPMNAGSRLSDSVLGEAAP